MRVFPAVLLMSLISASALASKPVEIAFVQSFEVGSPAFSGFFRGVLMQAPLPRDKWPSDVQASFPQSLIGRTELSLQYAADQAYPAYRRWVAVGQGFTSTLLIVMAIIGYRVWRSDKHA